MVLGFYSESVFEIVFIVFVVIINVVNVGVFVIVNVIDLVGFFGFGCMNFWGYISEVGLRVVIVFGFFVVVIFDEKDDCLKVGMFVDVNFNIVLEGVEEGYFIFVLSFVFGFGDVFGLVNVIG